MVARLQLSDSSQVARLTEKETTFAIAKSSSSTCDDHLMYHLDSKGSIRFDVLRLSSDGKAVKACPIPNQNNRRVRFAEDENGSIQEDVYIYKAVSETRKGRYYHSKADLQEMMQTAHQFAQDHISANPEWLNHVESLLFNSIESAGDDDSDVDHIIRLVSVSEARGLEFSSPLLQKHQAWAVQSVLRRQKQLMAQRNPEPADLLRERCERVNRFTRAMALKVAKGDALEARRIYESEP